LIYLNHGADVAPHELPIGTQSQGARLMVDFASPQPMRPASLIREAYAVPAEAVLRQLQVDFASGVTEDEAVLRLAQYGPNALATRPQVSALRILINQVKGPVVLLLGGAAALAGAFGDWTEAVAILLVLGINTLIGFVTELRAVRSMEALRRLGSRSSRVIVRRGGKVNIVPAEALVPGDIVLLDSGDIVTADLRLVEAANLCCDESTLTGESTPVDKTVAPVARNAVVADRTSMVHKGTAITRGTGLGVVVATGMATELGQITSLVIAAEPDTSPLERKLERLTAQLVKVTVLLAGLVGLAGVAMGRDIILMIEASIALAVAAIPEGLPIVATMALARGMWRMARRNALVERLAAVETLGATTVICADKTGTLTENQMTVERLWLPSARYRVDLQSGRVVDENGERLEPTAALRRAVEIGVLCSNATLQAADGGGAGDPMELALLRLGQLAGLQREALLLERPSCTSWRTS
jgi:P-type Ca2+ transporter type 2C